MKKPLMIVLVLLLIIGLFLALPFWLNKTRPVREAGDEDRSGLQERPPQDTPSQDLPDQKQPDTDDLPKIVHNNFIELDKISKVSKFRSGVGHDFSKGGNETDSCRSMKHYFEQAGITEDYYHKNISKDDWPVVKYFAPVSGEIIDMRSSVNMFGDEENQFLLKSDDAPGIVFGFFHVIIDPDLMVGARVVAGEFLGTISPGNSGEIMVSTNFGSPDERLISYFSVMDDKVFSEYEARGAKSREDFIITEQQRDSNPLICAKEPPYRFIGSKKIPDDKEKYDSWASGDENWFFLN